MDNIFSLEVRNIIISGASSGIGKACAKACAAMGARLVLFGRNETNLNALIAELPDNGHLGFAFDITDSDQLDVAMKNANAQIGHFDGFIHSAGIQKTLPLKLSPSRIFLEQYLVNVIAGFEVCRIALRKKYLNPNGSSLVFIASINGVIGAGAQVGYSASKGAVISAVKSLALELAAQKIRVNSISPGMVDSTPMTQSIISSLSEDWEQKNKSEYPLGWVTVDDIANTAIFLLASASSKITGTNIIVDGGFTSK